jgi:hypothetical protein
VFAFPCGIINAFRPLADVFYGVIGTVLGLVYTLMLYVAVSGDVRSAFDNRRGRDQRIQSRDIFRSQERPAPVSAASTPHRTAINSSDMRTGVSQHVLRLQH